MARKSFDEDAFPGDETIDLPYQRIKGMPQARKKDKSRPANVRKAVPAPTIEIAEQAEATFKMTYKASRHEAAWLEESLSYFFDQKWFDDVLRMVKGGKEASVYLCQGNPNSGADFLAAKVYRPRMFRNLRNDWLYREGRQNLDESGNMITNKGMNHAIQKRTEYGRELLHTSWLVHEYHTLQMLHEAGADVPKPYASGSNAILMEYLGDALIGAPALSEISLDASEARVLYERVIYNIDLMLSCRRVHGDLSAFNILYWEGEIRLIDFPQAIHPEENRSAYRIFERDVVRVSDYFLRQGVRSAGNPHKLAANLWEKHHHRFVPEVDPKALGEDNDTERDIWTSLRNA